MDNVWKDGQDVIFIDKDGSRFVRSIRVSLEGFAILEENGSELIFTQMGSPINEVIDQQTGGPRICACQPSKSHGGGGKSERSEPNYRKATFEQPWDNIFALKNLTLSEWSEMISTLTEIQGENDKIHLKNFGESASIENKKRIRKIFLKARDRQKE